MYWADPEQQTCAKFDFGMNQIYKLKPKSGFRKKGGVISNYN